MIICDILLKWHFVAWSSGTNLHNDAADFESGNDQPDRVGPQRVTAEGWANPASVRRAATISFALAFILGIYLVAAGGWPILLAGLASLTAATTPVVRVQFPIHRWANFLFCSSSG